MKIGTQVLGGIKIHLKTRAMDGLRLRLPVKSRLAFIFKPQAPRRADRWRWSVRRTRAFIYNEVPAAGNC